jgi:hypothetical protein
MSGVEAGLLAIGIIELAAPVVRALANRLRPDRRFQRWQCRVTEALRDWNALTCKDYVPDEIAEKISQMITK